VCGRCHDDTPVCCFGLQAFTATTVFRMQLTLEALKQVCIVVASLFHFTA
jgi:hypothetical protein